jgi:hypothetical protein
MKKPWTVFLLAWAFGCGGGGDGDGVDAGGEADAAVTYYRDVKPILDAKCVRCHVEDGIAPCGLTNYALAKTNAGVAMLAINDGIMPPWQAVDGCNDYVGNFDLTAQEIALFNEWVTAGTPAGDVASEGDPLVVEDIRLSRVDLSLTMPETYAPRIEPDDYRCFVIEWPEQYTTTRYVSGFNAVPGNDVIVHHVIAYLATPAQAAQYYALDEGEDGPGYTCFGGPLGPSQEWIGGWAPGGQGFDMPVGTGMAIEPGSLVILQIHYNTLYAPSSDDKTGIELKIEMKNFSGQDWTVEAGMRIAQLFILPFASPDLEEADGLPPSARGAGGFGSTGLT